jgi:transposase-like protein
VVYLARSHFRRPFILRADSRRSTQVILLAVGWYLRFSLSYRDVEELLAERGVHVDHVTVWRWVQRYGRKWNDEKVFAMDELYPR